MAAPDFENECFFVTPIGEEGGPVREQADIVGKYVVAPAVERVGLVLRRADALAEPGQISHQVIDHVFNAKTVVADLTGSNPNVYYELALRHAARKPVVLIAHKEHMPKLAFDVSAERVIPYDHTDFVSAEKATKDIEALLRAGLDGVVNSPVASALNIRALEEGSPEDRVLADLSARMDQVARTVRDMANVVERSSGVDPVSGRLLALHGRARRNTEQLRFPVSRENETREFRTKNGPVSVRIKPLDGDSFEVDAIRDDGLIESAIVRTDDPEAAVSVVLRGLEDQPRRRPWVGGEPDPHDQPQS